MDIVDVSSVLSSVSAAATGSVAQQVSVEMLDKTMELTESMNTQLVQLMEQSVNPHIGGNLNLFI